MKKVISILFLFFLFQNNYAHSSDINIDDIYVQVGDKILPLRVLIEKNKNLRQYSKRNKFYENKIKLSSHEYGILKDSIAPDSIYVSLSLFNIEKNKIIFFDNNCLKDNSRNCIRTLGTINKEFWIEPGMHKIELKEENLKVTDTEMVTVNSKSFVECSGIPKMKCIVKGYE